MMENHQNRNNEGYEKSLITYKRIGAYCIDFFICLFVAMIPFGILSRVSDVLTHMNDEEFNQLFSLVLCLSLMMKDVVGIGKRCTRIYIGDHNSAVPSRWNRRILRNITYVITPIEVVLLLLKRERLGDRLAKTDVYLRKPNKTDS